MISKASAEAVDGGPSKQARSSLLALTARGETSPQVPAGGRWRLLPSRAKCGQHLAANTTVSFSARAVFLWSALFTMEVQPVLGNAETAKEPQV